jgi:hypothetical protein
MEVRWIEKRRICRYKEEDSAQKLVKVKISG